MDLLFGKKKTVVEQMRECKRTLARASRDIDNERRRLENEDKRIQVDIKNMAKKNQIAAVKTLARDLVRTRNQVKKMIMMNANIKTMELTVTTLKSTTEMSEVMKKMTRSMQSFNRAINLPAMQQIMIEFEKQSEIMEMKEEMMNDVMSDVFEDSETSEQTDQIVDQILSELGIEMNDQLNELKPSSESLNASGSKDKSRIPATVAAADVDPSDLDLEERLNRLKRD